MTIHLQEVCQICDDSFSRGQPPISMPGHWRIFSYERPVTPIFVFHFIIHLFVYIFLNCSSFKYFRLWPFNLVPKIIVIRGTYQFIQKMGITLYYIFWKFLYDLHCLLKLKRMTPYTPYRPQHASHCFQTCKEISAPTGAWKWNAFPFLFMWDWPTNQLNHWQTNIHLGS